MGTSGVTVLEGSSIGGSRVRMLSLPEDRHRVSLMLGRAGAMVKRIEELVDGRGAFVESIKLRMRKVRMIGWFCGVASKSQLLEYCMAGWDESCCRRSFLVFAIPG